MPLLTWKRALALALALSAVGSIGYSAWAASWIAGGIGFTLLLVVVMLVAVGTYRRVGFGIQQMAEQRAALARLGPDVTLLLQATHQIDASLRSAAISDLRLLVLNAFRDVQEATAGTPVGLERVTVEVGRLEHAIRAIDARTNALAGAINQGSHEIGDLTQVLKTHRAGFDARLSDVEQVFAERLEETRASVGTRLSTVENLVSSLDRRFSLFEQELRDLLKAQSEQVKREIVTPVRALTKEIGGTRLRFDVLNDAIAMRRILGEFDLTGPAPEMSGWSLEPVALERILELVRSQKPRLIVECGSGVSTVWLAVAARAYGGRVVALEHHHDYALQTRQEIERHGLAAIADVRDASLEDVEIFGKAYSWYSRAAWETLSGIDLLLVDGPPKATGPHARFPALPLLGPALASQATVVLDDIHRKEEREVLSLWNDHLPARLGTPVEMGQRSVSIPWTSPVVSQ